MRVELIKTLTSDQRYRAENTISAAAGGEVIGLLIGFVIQPDCR